MNYLWNFGDGFTSPFQVTSHIFTTPGYMNVSFSAKDTWGSSSTTAQLIYISPAIAFSPTAFPLEGVYFQSIEVTLTSGQPNALITYTLNGEDPEQTVSILDTSNNNFIGYSISVSIFYSIRCLSECDSESTSFHNRRISFCSDNICISVCPCTLHRNQCWKQFSSMYQSSGNSRSTILSKYSSSCSRSSWPTA